MPADKPIETLADLTPEWRDWLDKAGWLEEFDPDLRLVIYTWDDDIDGDIWEDGPHLAIKDADGPIPYTLAWPVDIDGWANAREIGWAGIDKLLAEGRRI